MDLDFNEIYDVLRKMANKVCFGISREDKEDLINDVLLRNVERGFHLNKSQTEFTKISSTALMNLFKDRFYHHRRGGSKLMGLCDSVEDSYIPIDKRYDLIDSMELPLGERNFFDLLIDIRWGGDVRSPYTNKNNVAVYSSDFGVFRCLDTLKYFTLHTNTIFDTVRCGYSKNLPWNYILIIVNEIRLFNFDFENVLQKLKDRWYEERHCKNNFPGRGIFKFLFDRIKSIFPNKHLNLREALEFLFDYKIDDNMGEKETTHSYKIPTLKEFSHEYIKEVFENPQSHDNDELLCIVEFLRWGKEVKSPYVLNSKIYIKSGKLHYYRCKESQHNFTPLTRTIFDNMKMEIYKIFVAVREFFNGRKTSTGLMKVINVTQVTAWKLIYNIKVATVDITEQEKQDIVQFFSHILQFKRTKEIIVPPEAKPIKLPNKVRRIENKTSDKSIEMEDKDKVKETLRYLLDNDLPLPMEFVDNYNKNHKLN